LGISVQTGNKIGIPPMEKTRYYKIEKKPMSKLRKGTILCGKVYSAPRQCGFAHTTFGKAIFDQKQVPLFEYPVYSIDWAPCDFPVPGIKKQFRTELTNTTSLLQKFLVL
jgi:hypothetical protein